MEHNGHVSGLYDLDQIKAISITEVCRLLNVPLERKGGTVWCKLRDERTASCKINTHTIPNTYIDFGGSNRRSDVIQFVCEAGGMDRKDAIKFLAGAFNIAPIKQERRDENELTFWEFEKLGLYGDLATKNFSFNIEKQGFDRVAELSAKYGMPMNDLRKKHPKVYEQLLRDHAIPRIREMRNTYYLGIINLHHILKISDFTLHPGLSQSLKEDIKDLQTAERLFIKATAKTSIKANPVGEYDPDLDMKKILAGEIKPEIGNRSYGQLQSAAKQNSCGVKYRTIPWDKFNSRGLDRFPHTAFFRGDQVTVGYLEKDHEEIKPLFDKMFQKERLSNKIATAENKRTSRIGGTAEKAKYEPAR